MEDFSYISNANPAYLETLYNEFKQNPGAVEEEWKKFFEGFDFALQRFGDGMPEDGEVSPKELQVYALIEGYRDKGHLLSKTNPIRERKDRHPHLSLADYGLTKEDLKSTFIAGKQLNLQNPTLENIIDKLEKIYCRSLGFEYTHTYNKEEREWLQENIESRAYENKYSDIEIKKRILRKLNECVVFEKFLNTKYIGQKRFSLEGGESTIPALDAIINKAADLGAEEIVMGMAHRGRLNVLANIMGKTYEHIFSEFEGTAEPDMTMGDGDVKYHLGYSSLIDTPAGKKVHVKIAPNPSHLEAVNPVVEGFTRAKADILYQSDYARIMPILIHGDAALPGQGVGFEVAQMSQLEGYHTGGTIHFVINNQIGFTTDFDDARSSTYSTGIANAIQAPVIHVNGDDVESVVFAVELATEYRYKFNKDVFIDMVCYRRHGHNEGDEPKFTQPTLYNIINKHSNPRDIYVKKLVDEGDIEKEIASDMDKEFWQMLQDRLDMVKQQSLPYKYQEPELAWRALRKSKPEDFEQSPKTAVKKSEVNKVLKGIMNVPEGFNPLRKVNRLLKSSQKLIDDEKVDWALAELSAYGTILLEGNDVRMSGQDTKRGTFSHRHAMLHDEETSKEYNRLAALNGAQGEFRIYNSLLSEFGVLGFEYGYSLASPNTLTLWEAQFGDFSNGAQTIIDQFITSSESKWQRMSGIVMLLPHGYEGQGPEHSSARLERFLQMCAEFNISVANCTTPANFFHILRRQLARPFRKPLVIMSPKSLLRHPKVISSIDELTKGGFQEIIDDPFIKTNKKKVRKVLLCSGKVYYDLQERQEQEKIKDVAIVRLEQLYPLAYKQLDAILDKYPEATVHWVQEEPSNMGAWVYMLSCYGDRLEKQPISRKSSASPATGYSKMHAQEQEAIVNKAFE